MISLAGSSHMYCTGVLCILSLCRCLHVCSTMSLFVMVKSPHIFPVALHTMTFQLSWLIVALSKVSYFIITLDRSRYNLCPGVSALGATASFHTLFCLALDLAQRLHVCSMPHVETHPSSLAVFLMESSFQQPSRQWAILILSFTVNSILEAAISAAGINLHAYIAPFSVDTTMLNLMTPFDPDQWLFTVSK